MWCDRQTTITRIILRARRCLWWTIDLNSDPLMYRTARMRCRRTTAPRPFLWRKSHFSVDTIRAIYTAIGSDRWFGWQTSNLNFFFPHLVCRRCLPTCEKINTLVFTLYFLSSTALPSKNGLTSNEARYSPMEGAHELGGAALMEIKDYMYWCSGVESHQKCTPWDEGERTTAFHFGFRESNSFTKQLANGMGPAWQVLRITENMDHPLGMWSKHDRGGSMRATSKSGHAGHSRAEMVRGIRTGTLQTQPQVAW